MTEALPTILVPGLACSPRLYAEQVPLLWRGGPVIVADHTRHDRMEAIADAVLAAAPPRFRLLGLSMGGYVALAIMRRAPERVDRLALLDTSARPDRPDQTERRRQLMALAAQGRELEVADTLYPALVHVDRRGDAVLHGVVRRMMAETGPEAFIRQEEAIIARADSRPSLSAIRCPTLVLVGEADTLTPPELSQEMAAAITGAELVVVPGSGHLSTLEEPAAVNQAIDAWMRR